jgi:hypothetical protein
LSRNYNFGVQNITFQVQLRNFRPSNPTQQKLTPFVNPQQQTLQVSALFPWRRFFLSTPICCLPICDERRSKAGAKRIDKFVFQLLTSVELREA